MRSVGTLPHPAWALTPGTSLLLCVVALLTLLGLWHLPSGTPSLVDAVLTGFGLQHPTPGCFLTDPLSGSGSAPTPRSFSLCMDVLLILPSGLRHGLQVTPLSGHLSCFVHLTA